MGEDWQSDFSCDGLANITSIPSIVKTTLSGGGPTRKKTKKDYVNFGIL